MFVWGSEIVIIIFGMFSKVNENEKSVDEHLLEFWKKF
jgi:hypothetical protein